jgi:hypothetical protein
MIDDREKMPQFRSPKCGESAKTTSDRPSQRPELLFRILTVLSLHIGRLGGLHRYTNQK